MVEGYDEVEGLDLMDQSKAPSDFGIKLLSEIGGLGESAGASHTRITLNDADWCLQTK